MAEITAELNLKIAGLQAGLEKARAEMAGFKKFAQSSGHGIGEALGSGISRGLAALGIGGLGAGSVTYALTGMVEQYGHLADLSQRFNAEPEGMQRLQFHARLAGTTLDAAANAVGKLQVALERTNDPTVVAALKELRISAVTLAGESPERQFQLLADAFNRAQAEGRGLSATKDLLKNGFAELLPMLREWNEISKQSIPIVSNEDVAVLKEFGDQWERIKMSSQAASAAAVMNTVRAKPLFDVKGSGGAQAFPGAAWMGQGGMGVDSKVREAMTQTEEARGSWLSGLLSLLGKSESLASTFNTKLESYRRTQEEASRKAEEAARELRKKQEIAERKSREGVTSEEQSVQIAELRASGKKSAADKLERLQRGQKDFQRLRDAYPEMGEDWALKMAHRRDEAMNRTPGRIHGYKGTGGSKPGEGLDWLYGHNRDRGGQAMNREFKFPALDEMNRTLKNIEKAVE